MVSTTAVKFKTTELLSCATASGMDLCLLDYTRRARVAPKELFVLSGHPNFSVFSSKFCILWIMIYNHGLWANMSNDVFLTYLQNSQISPNSSKFCSFLAKSERFERDRRGRTEDERTEEDGRTHSSNLRLTYTKSPFGAKISQISLGT